MRYIRVVWTHDHPDEAVELYSELDGESWEVRTVEVFRDGKLAFASPEGATGSTRLRESPLTPIRDIARQSEFRPEEISRAEFERIWDLTRSPLPLR